MRGARRDPNAKEWLCARCKQLKLRAQFPFKSEMSLTRGYYCEACLAEHGKQRYRQEKEARHASR